MTGKGWPGIYLADVEKFRDSGQLDKFPEGKSFLSQPIDGNRITVPVKLGNNTSSPFPWNKYLHASIINWKDSEKNKIRMWIMELLI